MRRYNVLVLVSVMAVVYGGSALGATRTFNGTVDDKWSVAGNWQDSLKPSAGDSVVVATAACQADEAVPALSGLTINNGSTFTANGQTLTVNGAWVDNGTFVCGTSTVVFGGTSAAVTEASPFANLTVAVSSSYYLTVTGEITVGGTLTLASGRINGSTIRAQGDVSCATTFGSGGSGGSVLLMLDGGGDQTLTGAGSETAGCLPSVEIAKASGMVTLAGGTIRLGGSWTETSAGTLSVGAVKFVFAGISPTLTAKSEFADVKVAVSSSYHLTVNGEAAVNGVLTLACGRLNGGTLHARGNVAHETAFGGGNNGGSSLLKIDGEGDQTLTGAGSETLGALPSVSIDKPSGNLSLAGGTIRLGNNWTESSTGTLSVNETKLVFAGVSGTLSAKSALADLKLAVSTSYYVTVVGEATVNGTLTLASGRLNGGLVHARGNVICGTDFGGASGGSAVLRFDSNADQTLTGAGSETSGCLPKVEVDKPSGSLALAGGVIRAAQDWVVKNGAVDIGTAKVILVGYSTQVKNGVFYDLVLNKGATWGSVTLVGPLSIAHDLDVQVGELVVGTNPITLNGTEAQSFNPAGAEVTNLSVTNVGGTVTMVGGLTGRKLSLAAGSSVAFTAGQTYRFIELEMEGTAEAPITLRSSSTGTQWLLDVPEHAAVYHVDVRDSNASLGSPVTDVSGVDSGNDLNWLFRTPAYVAITTPASSATSPAWVEGDCGADVSELEVTVNSGEPFAAAMETPIRWYADNASAAGKAIGIELSPDAATALSVTATGEKGGENTVEQDLVWAVTDIATSSSSITIRQGDSLLLTATGEGEELTIDANGDSTVDFTGEPGETYAAAYTTAGVYDAVARIDDEVVGTLTVTVVSVEMSNPIACQVGYERTVELPVVPAGALSSVSFLSNTDVQMSVSVDAPITGGVRLKLTAQERGTPVLQARLDGATGPMLALREVDEFTLDISAREMVLINGDTREGPGTVIMRPYVPNLELHFHMNSSQSRFLRDGEEVSTYDVDTSDEDEVEQVFDAFTGETVGQHVNMFHVPVGEDSYCWQVQVKQPGPTTVTVGTSGGVNGPVNELYLGGALLFVREHNDEDADSVQAVESWESSGVGPDPVEERRLSFIESGSAGAWKMRATTEALYGRETDRSWSAPGAAEQYVSRGNFRSYVPPYLGDEEGEELTWPLDGYWEEFNDEVADDKVFFKPGIQYGVQDLEVSSSACGVLVKFPEKIVIARLEVDGAVPADPGQPLSNTNITSSTRDPFPRVIGELPERTVEYVEVEGEQNAKPIAILKVAADQAVWSGSGNLSVNFDASASYDPDAGEGESLVYKWDYEGTGNWETGTATGSHVYAPRTEAYVAKLKVSDVDETESQVAEFQRIIVHQNPTDAEPEPTAVVPEPLGVPVQVTLYTALGTSVDVKLKVNIAEDETEGKAFVSLSGARKECSTPEYFRMTAGPNGYASCIVYLQGVHYSTVADSIQLIVEGKEQIEPAKDSPDKHFEWETAQQDGDYQPFICTDEESLSVVRLEFIDKDNRVVSSPSSLRPSPVVILDPLPENVQPGQILQASGIVKTFIAPIAEVSVNGTSAALTLQDSGPDGRGPFIARFSTSIDVGYGANVMVIAREVTGKTAQARASVSFRRRFGGDMRSNSVAAQVCALWHLDDSAAEVLDSGARHNNGTNIGASSVQGRYGLALDFDGAGNRVEVPDDDTLDVSEDLTVEAWVNPSVVSGTQAICAKWGEAGCSYGLFLQGNRVKALLSGTGTAGDAAILVSGGTIQSEQWTHIAMVRKGAEFSIWINGVKDAETAPFAGAIYASTTIITLGAQSLAADSAYFHGKLDEVQISRTPRFPLIVQDSSGNGNHGLAFGPTTGVPGRVGTAYQFDGMGDSVSTPDAPSLRVTSDFVLDAWVCPASVSGNQAIIGKWGSGKSYLMWIAGDKLKGSVTADGTTATEITSTSSLAVGQWTRVGLVRSGDEISLWIDGNKETNVVSFAGEIDTSTAPLTIGSTSVSGAEMYFAGLIDEARLLSSSAPNSTTLCLYHFDECVGQFGTAEPLSCSIVSESGTLDQGISLDDYGVRVQIRGAIPIYANVVLRSGIDSKSCEFVEEDGTLRSRHAYYLVQPETNLDEAPSEVQDSRVKVDPHERIIAELASAGVSVVREASQSLKRFVRKVGDSYVPVSEITPVKLTDGNGNALPMDPQVEFYVEWYREEGNTSVTLNMNTLDLSGNDSTRDLANGKQAQEIHLNRVSCCQGRALYRSKPIVAALDEVLYGEHDVSGLFPNHEIVNGDVLGYVDVFASPGEGEAMPGWLAETPGVYRKVEGTWRPLAPQEWNWPTVGKAELTEIVVNGLAAQIKSPFVLPQGFALLVGKDDLAMDKCRMDGSNGWIDPPADYDPKPEFKVYSPHLHLDLGCRISNDGGATFQFMPGQGVFLISKDGYYRKNQGALEQKLVFEKNDIRLVLLIVYGHVVPKATVPQEWTKVTKEVFEAGQGNLENNDANGKPVTWNAKDPELLKKNEKKGPHIDFAFGGFADTADFAIKHYVEMNRVIVLGQAAANENDWDYVAFRRTALDTTILQALVTNKR